MGGKALGLMLLMTALSSAAGNSASAAESALSSAETVPVYLAADSQELRPAISSGAAGASGTGTLTNPDPEELKGPMAGEAATSTPPVNSRLMNQVNSQQGILSQSQGHKHGIITRALGGAASDVGHATMALIGTTILNQGVDLPPDDASEPEWPFREPNRKAMYYVNWADGSSSKVSRLPDGTVQILGAGKRLMLQPEGDGNYAMFGDYGSMATVTPRLDGGYTIIRADGRSQQILPRPGGGFNVCDAHGSLIATITPGVGNSKHIRGQGFSSGFLHE